MKRRGFFFTALAAPFSARASWLDWRIHELARHVCSQGPVLALVLRGQPWKLSDREREFVNQAAQEMNALETPAGVQRFPAKPHNE
jgi:hypothetical protein